MNILICFQLSEFLSDILGGESDIFKSEDLVLWQEIPIPTQSILKEFPPPLGFGFVIIGGFVTLKYSMYLFKTHFCLINLFLLFNLGKYC